MVVEATYQNLELDDDGIPTNLSIVKRESAPVKFPKIQDLLREWLPDSAEGGYLRELKKALGGAFMGR